MCDEGTDCSNLEHLSFNTHIVDDELEDFLGFYEIENINNCICNQRCVAKI